MSTSKPKSKTPSGSKTTNVQVMLGLLKDIGKIVEAVPYLEAIAGLLKVVVEMQQEYIEGKERWIKTMEGVRDIQDIIADALSDADDSDSEDALPLPGHLRKAMGCLEKCVLGIAEAFDKIDDMNGVKRFFHRHELKAAAEVCAADVTRALELFQMKLQMKLAVQVDAIHHIITSGATRRSPFAHAVLPDSSVFFTGRSALLGSLNTLFRRPGRSMVTIMADGGSDGRFLLWYHQHHQFTQNTFSTSRTRKIRA